MGEGGCGGWAKRQQLVIERQVHTVCNVWWPHVPRFAHAIMLIEALPRPGRGSAAPLMRMGGFLSPKWKSRERIAHEAGGLVTEVPMRHSRLKRPCIGRGWC
jgi:hypothetical protein